MNVVKERKRRSLHWGELRLMSAERALEVKRAQCKEALNRIVGRWICTSMHY